MVGTWLQRQQHRDQPSTVRLRKVDQFPALRSVETNEQTRTLAWKQVRPRSSINNDEIEPESTHDGGYDFARAAEVVARRRYARALFITERGQVG